MPCLSRRCLIKGLTLLLCVLVAQPASSQSQAGLSPSQAPATKRPLRMLALGDSVMWGQGLLDEYKFSYKLRDWLCAQRGNVGCQNGQDVQLHVEAHSGAVISKPDKKQESEAEQRFIRVVAPIRYAGEVNNAYPTLWGQIELAKRYYKNNSIPPEEVDLVLVNGGINDLNATRLLVGRLFGGDVKKLTRKYCGDEMTRFLLDVADTFPNARILVPGYFPLISESTPPNILWQTLREWIFGAKETEGKMVEAFDEDWAEQASDSISIGTAKTAGTIRRLAQRSREFVQASDEALKDAVKHLNERRPPLPAKPTGATAPPPEASVRGMFVPIPFGDNAYATPNSFLWRLARKAATLKLKCADDNFVTRFVVNDDMQSDRPCMCDQAGRKNDLVCFRAGAFHPNREGANAYFDAIKKRLQDIVGYTGWTASN